MRKHLGTWHSSHKTAVSAVPTLPLQVYAAKRTAMLQVAEADGVNTKDKRIKRIARQLK